jgi:hypothetical protein
MGEPNPPAPFPSILRRQDRGRVCLFYKMWVHHAHRAVLGLVQAFDAGQQGGFAGPVRARQAEDFAGFHGQRDVLHGHRTPSAPAMRRRKLLDFDAGPGHSLFSFVFYVARVCFATARNATIETDRRTSRRA